MKYHSPVLLEESVDGLNINGDEICVDATFGGGGHSKEILKRLGVKGRLFGFDQDASVKQNVINDERFELVQHNFRYIKNYLKFFDVLPIDCLLADLGVSSHQFDIPSRGFSIRYSGPLDMRMNQEAQLTAEVVLNEYDRDDLLRVFNDYGEVKKAKQLVDDIVKIREEKRITTTQELIKVAEKFAPRNSRNKYLAKVFQAIRIEVNDELGALKELLEQAYQVLREGGRLSVITYHSLEDRLVKNFIKKGKFDGDLEKDFYGNPVLKFKQINRRPLTPSEEEQNNNSRSRSAKLRIAEKTGRYI